MNDLAINFIRNKQSYTILNSTSDMLNIIRIVAALSVLIGHGFSFFQVSIFKDDTYFPYIQSLAVLVFFILSGFLTDNSLCRKTEQYNYCFYIKERIKRIYIYFIPALLLIYCLDKVFIYMKPESYLHYDAFDVEIVIKNILMLPRMVMLRGRGRGYNTICNSVFRNTPFGSARPLWTLFIEWWLYMFYGYYQLVFMRKHKKRLATADIFMVFAFVLMFIHLDIESQCCILAFMGGVAVNRTYEKLVVSRKKLFVGMILMFLLFGIDAYSVRQAYCLQMCLFLIILFYIALVFSTTFSKKTASRVLKEMSAISFSLYLLHYSIFEFVIGNYFHWSSKITFTISIVISLIIATIFNYMINRLWKIISKNKKLLQQV